MSKALLLLLPFISLTCNAENFVLTKANDDLNRNLAAFNEQDDQCRESSVVLPSDTFTGIQADKTQLKAALAYFYFKALHECSEAAVKEYLLSASVMAALAEPERAQGIHESNQLIVDARLHALKAEALYQKLDEKLRQSLQQIETLRRPFKLNESAKALGID